MYPHPNYVANITEEWWGVCDAAEERCVTVACFSPLCAEAAVSDSGSSGYITPIGYFGVAKAMDVRWSVYMFPYRHDAVVGGRTIRDWVWSLKRATVESGEGETGGHNTIGPAATVPLPHVAGSAAHSGAGSGKLLRTL